MNLFKQIDETLYTLKQIESLIQDAQIEIEESLKMMNQSGKGDNTFSYYEVRLSVAQRKLRQIQKKLRGK